MDTTVRLNEQSKFVMGIAPVADAFAGTVSTDVVSVRDVDKVVFHVIRGVATGGTGASTFTVEACDDVTPSNTTAVTFYYQQTTSGETYGALTAATTSGFTCTAGSNVLIQIEVDADVIASSGYGFVRLKAVESVNDPVVGSVYIQLGDSRYRPVNSLTTLS